MDADFDKMLAFGQEQQTRLFIAFAVFAIFLLVLTFKTGLVTYTACRTTLQKKLVITAKNYWVQASGIVAMLSVFLKLGA